MICIYCEAARGNWIIARTQTYTHPTFTYAQYEMKVAWPASGSAFALGNTSLTASCSAITLFHLLANGSCPTTPPSPTSNIPLLYFKSALTERYVSSMSVLDWFSIATDLAFMHGAAKTPTLIAPVNPPGVHLFMIGYSMLKLGYIWLALRDHFGLDNLTGQLLQEESDCTAVF
ncbi:hypothetical protein BDQ17DRAFT_1431455 [Cyathus striatus]|nr:hypothetical protein BDQ17DRAFT_1431455 [Cyathus striatus]